MNSPTFLVDTFKLMQSQKCHNKHIRMVGIEPPVLPSHWYLMDGMIAPNAHEVALGEVMVDLLNAVVLQAKKNRQF
ncbi:hypothetical protein LXL04_007993 [Taraxacum kok-saghyz]